MTKSIFEEGYVFLVNKPLEWTSFDVVKKMRSALKIKKIGHAGTLDPLATGLLIICAGKFTKRINEFMAQKKEYTGIFTLGAVTPTYDLESRPENFKSYDHITKENLIEAAQKLTGEISQIPPMHSAIKHEGKRVYELARKGIEVELKPRIVTIYNFEITKTELPEVHFKIECSTGTYIRSMANDFGKLLGCGAYLSKLTRTKIGEYHVDESRSIEETIDFIKQSLNQNG